MGIDDDSDRTAIPTTPTTMAIWIGELLCLLESVKYLQRVVCAVCLASARGIFCYLSYFRPCFSTQNLPFFAGFHCRISRQDLEMTQNDPKNPVMKSCSEILQKPPLEGAKKFLVSAEFHRRIFAGFFQIAPPSLSLSPRYDYHISLSLTAIRISYCQRTLPSFIVFCFLHCRRIPHLSPLSVMVVGYKAAAAMLLYQQLQLDADEDFFIENVVMPMVRRGMINSHHARRRRRRHRRSWSAFRDNLTDRQFRLYFRMSKELFQLLCDEIEDILGRGKFKSEEFLYELKNSDDINRRRMVNANECTSGGFVCGEVKLATTLRILGGASALDMALLFDFAFANAYKIFHEVIHNWLSHELFCPIDGIQYCTNDEKMASVALQFCEHSSGIINGCIGALDGWVVKVQKPNFLGDDRIHSRAIHP